MISWFSSWHRCYWHFSSRLDALAGLFSSTLTYILKLSAVPLSNSAAVSGVLRTPPGRLHLPPPQTIFQRLGSCLELATQLPKTVCLVIFSPALSRRFSNGPVGTCPRSADLARLSSAHRSHPILPVFCAGQGHMIDRKPFFWCPRSYPCLPADVIVWGKPILSGDQRFPPGYSGFRFYPQGDAQATRLECISIHAA